MMNESGREERERSDRLTTILSRVGLALKERVFLWTGEVAIAFVGLEEEGRGDCRDGGTRERSSTSQESRLFLSGAKIR